MKQGEVGKGKKGCVILWLDSLFIIIKKSKLERCSS